MKDELIYVLNKLQNIFGWDWTTLPDEKKISHDLIIDVIKICSADSIEFAEWIVNKYEKLPSVGKNIGKWREKGKQWLEAKELTTEEMFQLFKSTKK